MRISSSTPPPGAFAIEPMPGQPGKARIRFFENAEQITEKIYWEYDEYRLVVDEQAGIDGMVAENYTSLIERAKLAEDYPDEDPGRIEPPATVE